jgi:hypothetical protein
MVWEPKQPGKSNSVSRSLFAACLIVASAASQTAAVACEPVVAAKAGYVRDADGNYALVPDTNLAKYESVLHRCPKGLTGWTSQHYFGFADSIVFRAGRYWCIDFIDGRNDFRLVKRIKKSDCI